ncbi:MAG: hypothetical protein K8I02_04540, partial [Candidatus Methylomirabilis sp.]|nr:hypothetical protein [Deltaproteobacteria bacterium]
FLIDGLTSLAAMQGASVRSFDAANPHSPLATLGNVPGDVAALAMLGGYRSARLGLGLPPGVDESGDVFFFDADRPDSLARVTSTPSIGEVPAGQY